MYSICFVGRKKQNMMESDNNGKPPRKHPTWRHKMVLTLGIRPPSETMFPVGNNPKKSDGSYGVQEIISQMLRGAGIFTYIWVILVVNVGKYSIHGASG